MKYAVVTTFPNKHWKKYASAMVESYLKFWPMDVDVYVCLDEDEGLNFVIGQVQGLAQGYNRPVNVAHGAEQEQKDFIARNINRPEEKSKDWRKQYVRFSHKVFAIARAAEQIEADYLIWIDADVVTNMAVTDAEIKKWLPKGKVCSYLGRKDGWPSETGFLIFDLKNGGKEFIKLWRDMYIQDKLLEHPDNTDAFAFDLIRNEYTKANSGKDVFKNLAANVTGRDVFEKTSLGKHMVHYKGPRKNEVKPMADSKITYQHTNTMAGGVFDVNNLGIKTKNCIQDDSIKEHVSRNLRLIDNWIVRCKDNDEEIVICSAGPSLSVDDIKPYYDKGVKVVAVKHALNKLLEAGIVPWACILLDPRDHVSGFVEDPHPDINYFVSSMVDPAVVERLRKKNCKVIGYHARVGAGEEERIPLTHEGGKHLWIEGGSATATRGISILEALGFRKMHLFGYDCCYLQKPDLNEKKENGKLRYEEVTLAVETWGGQKIKRTFWTEGQFLAQVQEMKKLYLPKPHISYYSRGYGVIPWMHEHMLKYQAWLKDLELKHNTLDAGAKHVDEFLNGIDKSSCAT